MTRKVPQLETALQSKPGMKPSFLASEGQEFHPLAKEMAGPLTLPCWMGGRGLRPSGFVPVLVYPEPSPVRHGPEGLEEARAPAPHCPQIQSWRATPPLAQAGEREASESGFAQGGHL